MPHSAHLLAAFVTGITLVFAGCVEKPSCPEPPKCAECPKEKACPACPECPTAQPTAADVTLPPFVLAALNGPHADRAKLYFDGKGTLTKTTAYVAKDAIPAWAIAAADKELGAGEDKDFEVEQYSDGTQTYEITRTVKGAIVELSLDAKSKAVRYTERKMLKLDTMPAKVATAAKSIAGFAIKEYGTKVQSGVTSHELYGTKDGKKWEAAFDENGQVLHQRAYISATLRMSR